MFRLCCRLGPVAFALLICPSSAEAHTSVPGLNDFSAGLLHPVTTPPHLLILLGLGFLAAQHARSNLKLPLIFFAAAGAAALAFTTTRLIHGVNQPVLLTVALCLGVLVALDRRLPTLVLIALSAIAATLIGLDSVVETGSLATVIKTQIGTWVALVLVVFDIAFYVSRGAQRQWVKVGVRVLGSWIIAVSLLVLAFSLRRNGPPS
jgi:hydrogenase/urease accessory protein HupE